MNALSIVTPSTTAAGSSCSTLTSDFIYPYTTPSNTWIYTSYPYSTSDVCINKAENGYIIEAKGKKYIAKDEQAIATLLTKLFKETK